MNEIERKIRDAAIHHIVKYRDIPKDLRYEVEQFFANEVDLFVAGARCAFQMIQDNFDLYEKEGRT